LGDLRKEVGERDQQTDTLRRFGKPYIGKKLRWKSARQKAKNYPGKCINGREAKSRRNGMQGGRGSKRGDEVYEKGGRLASAGRCRSFLGMVTWPRHTQGGAKRRGVMRQGGGVRDGSIVVIPNPSADIRGFNPSLTRRLETVGRHTGLKGKTAGEKKTRTRAELPLDGPSSGKKVIFPHPNIEILG